MTDQVDLSKPGGYGSEGCITWAYCPPARYCDDNAMLGSWIVGDTACGLCIREDTSEITQDLSRFVPHVISV
ncbi:glutathionylspermidine synthase family protein [Leisingera aquaemixtae]|uniref:glutathionylspermidine synthase family protein n=1 Tax=Leisingera aquaemixtae TaxID=1396826 RepID=UPI0021A49258|nr:glutathionylspermidine synthase family protein [Leisingera aquaemixtae]